jgi:hypothetical protein
VVCDHWFSSMPGPTEPNRYFMHVGTSGTFDDSPTVKEIADAVLTPGGGIKFKTRDMFKKLEEAGVKCKIYGGDKFPVVAELSKISPFDVDDFDDFVEDLRDKSFDAGFIHIEPQYDAIFGDFAAATIHSAVNQHLQIAPAEQHAAIRARVSQLKTRADAVAYLTEVESLLRAQRGKKSLAAVQ